MMVKFFGEMTRDVFFMVVFGFIATGAVILGDGIVSSFMDMVHSLGF